jgi:hypothetical protein
MYDINRPKLNLGSSNSLSEFALFFKADDSVSQSGQFSFLGHYYLVTFSVTTYYSDHILFSNPFICSHVFFSNLNSQQPHIPVLPPRFHAMLVTWMLIFKLACAHAPHSCNTLHLVSCSLVPPSYTTTTTAVCTPTDRMISLEHHVHSRVGGPSSS